MGTSSISTAASTPPAPAANALAVVPTEAAETPASVAAAAPTNEIPAVPPPSEAEHVASVPTAVPTEAATTRQLTPLPKPAPAQRQLGASRQPRAMVAKLTATAKPKPKVVVKRVRRARPSVAAKPVARTGYPVTPSTRTNSDPFGGNFFQY
jgi:hypothetical protein